MRTYRHILVALTMLGIVGFSTAAQAEDPGITVEIRSIAADKQGEGFDSKLSDLKSKLEKVFDDYTRFEQLTSVEFELTPHQTKSVTLPEGSQISVTYHGPADDLLKIGLEISDKLSTTLRASPGSTFFQAGLDYRSGILILAITVDR